MLFGTLAQDEATLTNVDRALLKMAQATRYWNDMMGKVRWKIPVTSDRKLIDAFEERVDKIKATVIAISTSNNAPGIYQGAHYVNELAGITEAYYRNVASYQGMINAYDTWGARLTNTLQEIREPQVVVSHDAPPEPDAALPWYAVAIPAVIVGGGLLWYFKG
jgi:hypothetical protein